MSSIILAFIVMTGYFLAYHTYGKFLGKKVFKLSSDAVCPSKEFYDNFDFVPTQKEILFGHHFTSIAGLGPILGPAIAIIRGWPAVIWIFFGAIFFGAVHDLGAFVTSLRSKGRSIGDLAGSYFPVDFKAIFGISGKTEIIVWIIIILVLNAWLASSLLEQTLLQPRDFINSHQLLIAMTLLVISVIVSHPPIVAPALNLAPKGAPPVSPFISVVIACRAISGFHSLASSGTSSKQCRNEFALYRLWRNAYGR